MFHSKSNPRRGAAAAAARPDRAGQVEGLRQGCIVGWARPSDEAGVRPVVQLWVDGQLAASASADLWREDLHAAGEPAGRSGFSIAVPAAYWDGQAHRASVRHAAAGETLAEGELEFRLFDTSGSLDECTDLAAVGWARCNSDPDGPVAVELWIDGARSGTGYAELHRPDLEAGGMGHGRYGFSLPWPDTVRDGKEHVAEVKTAAEGLSLGGSPKRFRIGARQQAAEGTLDEVSAAGALGWAAYADRRGDALDVELLVDDRPTQRVRADLLRGDLAAAGFGSGRHAFRLPLPSEVFDGQVHLLSVRPVGSTTLLNGSPKRVEFGMHDLFAHLPDTDALRKHEVISLAVEQLERLTEGRLEHRQHTALRAMHDWLRDQPFVHSRERVAAQLLRLTSHRCRLDLDGLVGPTRIEGRLVDRWQTHPVLEVELLDGDQVVARATTEGPSGRFAFQLPEHLVDGASHALALRIPAFGAALGPWNFLLLQKDIAEDPLAGWVGDPVWGALPRPADAAATTPAPPPTRVALAAAVARELLAADDEAQRPRTVQAVLDHAEALLAAGDWAAARETFGRARALDPAHSGAIAGEIRALAGLGDDTTALRLAKAATAEFPDDTALTALVDRLAGHRRAHDARVVAFYLPQFHPVPENNEWWGEGFTEWANVAAATPLFEGHLQPRRPTSLGYYDLRLLESANAQFELARRYGVDGFCYYYYWFEGRRVLDRPLQDLVEGRTGPFPFCICWANEDWTRSWDGATGEVLLAQNHSEESDMDFIRDLAPLLRHPDYIRVDGRPMVLIYRADRLAEPERTVRRWRQWCRDEGIGELHLCAVQSFGFDDPRPLGFDAAVEFPPHCLRDRYTNPPYLQELKDLPGLVDGFSGTVLDYQAFARAALARPREAYALHRTAMVAWDNTARRQKTAHIYHGFSVDTFTRWVEHNLRCAAREQGDGVCFINAWNEWAEGSVMEPDVHFGHEVLEATRRARERARMSPHETYWTLGGPNTPESRLAPREHVLLVGHDAHLHGAQTNLLNMARCLKRELRMDVSILLMEGGVLVPEYERVGPTFVIGRDEQWRDRLSPRLVGYVARGVRKAICNTVVTGEVCELLKQHGFRVVGLVHEMPTLIESGNLQGYCWRLAAQADALVFASRLVAREFSQRYWPLEDKVLIAPQGIALNAHVQKQQAARRKVREQFELSDDTLLVMGCGYGDTRKGFDLFIQMAGQVSRATPAIEVAFLWVGKVAENLAAYAQADLASMKLKSRFFITGQTREAPLYFAACDVFALSSREDPFPSVVMEAFDAGMPVVAFDGAGGFVDIVNGDTGALVPYLNVDAMSEAITALLGDDERRLRIGRHNHRLCREQFNYAPYMRKLLALLAGVPVAQVSQGQLQRRPWAGPGPMPRVSVVVPNYNYADYLELRLQSILAQTLPPHEIIVLDDASTDASVTLLRALAATSTIPIRIVESTANSGSPFPQWARGLEMASGDLVWIAEADDYCEPLLLETLAAELADERVVLAWADSVMVDESGASHGAQYKGYYAQRYGAKWSLPFRVPGRELIEDCLLTENVLPNASAIVFRRSALRPDDLLHLVEHRFSGDWWLWIALASRGEVCYRPEPLNYHRRHSRSVMGQVLRTGARLLHETIAFYQRLLDRSPELFTHRATRDVFGRLEQLYHMFPEHAGAPRALGSHPAYAAGHARLREGAERALALQAPARGPGLFVVSADALADASRPWRVLDRLEGRLPECTHWQVVVLDASPEARAQSDADELDFDEIERQEPGVVVLPAALEALQAWMADAGPFEFVASHGLAAACLVARLGSGRPARWWLVAASDFDALLGKVAVEPAVSIEGLALAVASCSQVLFTTDVPSHALARLAHGLKRPLERLRLDHGARAEPAADDDADLRVLALAPQAPSGAWRAAARALSAGGDPAAPSLSLTLLYPEGMSDETRRMHASLPGLRAQFTFLIPPPTRRLADLYVRDESSAATTRSLGVATVPLDAFLRSPAAAISQRAPVRRRPRRPPAEAPGSVPADEPAKRGKRGLATELPAASRGKT